MDEQIQHDRDVALAVLEPTPAELEHGLELHRDSVVVDAYGFAPYTYFDADTMIAAIEQGASGLEYQDLSEELWMTGCLANVEARDAYLGAFDAAGVTCIFQNAGVECAIPSRLMKRLARFTYVTDALRGRLDRAVTPDDVRGAKGDGRRCLLMSANAVPLEHTWLSVEEELGLIRVFFQLGVRMMHLTYNRRNMLGDGCAEPANAGLSDLGRSAIREMNRVGVIVDCAHAGWQSSLEAAHASDRPMVASHSGCAAVNEHVRCKPDEVIRAIADTGGYTGICCLPAFLGQPGDLNALLDHMDHAVRLVGADHVAIGTDRGFCTPSAIASGRRLPQRAPTRQPFAGFWPPNDPLLDPAWEQNERAASLAWTNWPMFTVGMVQRGHSDDAIQKILGQNVLRVLGSVLASAPGRAPV